MPLNSKRLNRHYDKLTPRERFSLMVSAFVRGDETEHQRLIRTSPRQTFSLPSYHGRSQAFREVAEFYIVTQMDIGIGLTCGMLGPLCGDKRDPFDEAAGLRVLSTRFMAWRDAWLRLCADYGIDGEGYLSLHPAGDTMRFLENLASDLAFTGEFAEAALHRADNEDVVSAVDERYELLKEMMEQRVASWT